MIYLKKFIFPDRDNDCLLPDDSKGSFYDENSYPFHITSDKELWSLDFEPITILYGSNGSGKSTIINVISEKLRAKRFSMFNSAPCFYEYVNRCHYKASPTIVGDSIMERLITSDKVSADKNPNKYEISKITTVLTSDDIFKAMLDKRQQNDQKLHKSYFLFDEYVKIKDVENPRHLNFETGYNVDKFKEIVELKQARNPSRNKSKSFNKLLLEKVGKMERCFSNGETALMRLSELLEKPGLYLLDEPENSMSCEFQISLASIIAYLARYGNCQFIISSHSPFLLSMNYAKIYNLDHVPVNVCKWWNLENMHHYFNLFFEAKDHFLSKK